jgi:hypothetical protein
LARADHAGQKAVEKGVSRASGRKVRKIRRCWKHHPLFLKFSDAR